MALKPLRPCRHPGCGALTREGWCPRHKPKERPRSEEAQAWRRWYSLPIWTDDLRPGRVGGGPVGGGGARRGRGVGATEGDHVVAQRGDWAKFIDRDNLQSLCTPCHSRKTMREITKRRRNF